MSSDFIEIRDLRARIIVGLLEHERVTPQPVAFDVTATQDISRAAATDDLDASTNYALLVSRTLEVAEGGAFLLLETLAVRVAETLLAEFTLLEEVEVAVRKLEPPIPADLASVGVRTRRRRA